MNAAEVIIENGVNAAANFFRLSLGFFLCFFFCNSALYANGNPAIPGNMASFLNVG